MRRRDEEKQLGPDAPDDAPVQLRMVWRRGPRTRAWDELWRWLLSDVTEEEGLGHRRGDGITHDAIDTEA